MTKPTPLPHSLLPDKPSTTSRQPSTTSRQLLLLTRECINFASVIQICKLRPRQGVIFPSGGKKNLEFGMLNVELSAKPILNYPILNWKFRFQESTTELKIQKFKMRVAHNSKLKTQNSKFKKLWQ